MAAALRSMPNFLLNSHRKSGFHLTHTRKGKSFSSGLSLNDRFGEI